MYLKADVYISRNDFSSDEIKVNEKFNQIVELLDLQNVYTGTFGAGISVEVPMGYWRKANHIHNWFVENIGDGVDECQKMFVPRDRLEELRDLVVQVIANPEQAEELLPTGEGFFFGSTEYDEWYFADLNDTLEILTNALESPYEYFEYQASW